MSTAWADIPESIIRESFVFCGITADILGADDNRMFAHVPKVVADNVDFGSDDDDDIFDDDDDSEDEFDGFDEFDA